MDESDQSLISAVTDVVSGVPEEVRKPFYKALADLIGGLIAVPAAKLDQFAQSIKDTTASRTLASNALAKAVAESVCDEPGMIALAQEVYLPTALRKAKNKIEVASRAATHLSTIFPDEKPENASPPDDDWMNNFMRFAEDASSERMRDLFGRILAGQVKKPKSFSVSTLRTLCELDQDIAEDFLSAWSLSVGESVDFSSYWQRGDGFLLWKRLSESGLMAPSSSSQFLPPFQAVINDTALWGPVSVDGVGLNVHFKDGARAEWQHIDFTRIGREIGIILDKPDFEKNIRIMAKRLPQSGLTHIYLRKDGVAPELLWSLNKR